MRKLVGFLAALIFAVGTLLYRSAEFTVEAKPYSAPPTLGQCQLLQYDLDAYPYPSYDYDSSLWRLSWGVFIPSIVAFECWQIQGYTDPKTGRIK